MGEDRNKDIIGHKREHRSTQSANTQSLNSDKKTYSSSIKVFFIGITIVFTLLCALIWSVSYDLPNLDEIDNPETDLSTKLISADGIVLQNYFSDENRVNTKLNKISSYVIDGLIATEDLRFYEHSGIDIQTFPAIIVRYLRGTISGGSTISMQLARNLFDSVGKERTVYRKIKEVIVSVLLERIYTKGEILAAYLNTVCIYGQSYGVETASRSLFGKKSQQLAVEEAAVIIAMLKGQGVYNPYRFPERVKTRRNIVIDNMAKHGFLQMGKPSIDSIKELPLQIASANQNHIQGLAPYFREHVRLYLQDWCKEKGFDFYTDGLQIHTTLDSRMQKHAEAALKTHLKVQQGLFRETIEGKEAFLRNPDILYAIMRKSDRYQAGLRNKKTHKEIQKEFDIQREMTIFHWDGQIDTTMTPWDSLIYYAPFLESGMVSIDPKNGEIKAWVGGIDYRFFKYDHVGKGTRQVGSTFKPFVYAAALNNGFTPCDQELNQPVRFVNVNNSGDNWYPRNADGRVGGLMTLKKGLATSTNLITARLMKTIGPEIVVKYAREMGITSPIEAVPSICLGTCDLSVLELTGAYGTFTNKGVWVAPTFISRIEDRHGKIIYDSPIRSKKVLSKEKAYEMIELLKSTVEEAGGTAQRLRTRYGFENEIGGKTGTTQNHSDAWFVGITPRLVSGVWVGCSDRRIHFESMKYGQGASLALPIWANYMKSLYEDTDIQLTKKDFDRPDGYENINCNEKINDQYSEFESMLLNMEAGPRNSDDFANFQ